MGSTIKRGTPKPTLTVIDLSPFSLFHGGVG
jgi:hypothetical protein